MENSNTEILSTETIEAIRRNIQTELLKRGFTAPITIEEKTTRSGTTLEITSEPFQTVPVIMSEIRIDGSLWVKKGDNEKESDRVSGQVGVMYKHFTGGSNGTELFSWSCVLYKLQPKDLFGLQIR